ncbi:D-aminoacyl-tRNA deacylase [Halobium salinum]|uniref:D-aminoacyl-tRNA deacylase n=1 Tax=Halobium salinum TaxID=1364940 RepID=A0ABD5PCU6_9EURY|nr:D-aminoacyl-tRNA deacylase [Halobium salinum]
MIAIVVSRADHASEHIGERLLDLADWTEHADESRADDDGGGTVYRLDAEAAADSDVDSADSDADSADPAFELRTFDAMHLDLDRPAGAFGVVEDGPEAGVDLLLFVSRHSGDTGPLLTCHFTGNFGPAKYGGADRRFGRAAPNAQKRLVAAFDDHAPEGYEVGVECTHHGPSEVGAPSMFVELGSGETEWADPDGARAVARSVLDLAGVAADVRGADGAGGAGGSVGTVGTGDEGAETPRHLVGFGGGHYAPRFERVLRETAWGVGHVAADWQLDELGDPETHPEVLRRTFAASAAEHALVEGEKSELRATLTDLGYRVVSETWAREVDDRPLALVAALENALGRVDDGLRFGNVVPDFGADDGGGPRDAFEVRALPGDLLSEAQGVDAGAVREAVAADTVAFWTEQSGTRAVGRAAFPATGGSSGDGDSDGAESTRDAYRSLVDALAAVLREKYDSVTVETEGDGDGAEVVARETAFVPAVARELGVPEGPAFGRLADGEAVEVDGTTVHPEDVRDERERRFAV